MTKADKTELTLPSGKKVAIATAKGKHLRQAARLAGADDPMGIGQALVSILATIDGAPVTYEEVGEMELADVLALQGAVMGNGTSSLKAISLN